MKLEDGRALPKRAARRFPTSMKKLREKHPSGVVVRASFVTDDGAEVIYEGKLAEEFFQVARAVQIATKSN